jgi:hypothetical protein
MFIDHDIRVELVDGKVLCQCRRNKKDKVKVEAKDEENK